MTGVLNITTLKLIINCRPARKLAKLDVKPGDNVGKLWWSHRRQSKREKRFLGGRKTANVKRNKL